MLSICTSLILILIPIPIPILILILIPILTRSRMYGPSSRPLRYDRSVPEGLPVPPYLAFPGYARGWTMGGYYPIGLRAPRIDTSGVGRGSAPGGLDGAGGHRSTPGGVVYPEGRLRAIMGGVRPIGLRFPGSTPPVSVGVPHPEG